MTQEVVLMTTEDLLALPEDGMDRDLIRGELKERPMTKRNRWHSGIEATIVYLLSFWLLQQPKPRGKIYSGEVGCILRRNPDTTVGIDVAYFSAAVVAQQSTATTLVEGVPTLAVEILSPTDKLEEIEAKLDEYLAAGVPLIWVVNPNRRTVTVYRPQAEPELFNVTQEISGEPHLPGFRVPVAAIFE